MKDVAIALYEFWNGFGIPAYPQDHVPDDAELPYITYEVKQPNWRGASSYSVSVYYRDTSYEGITETVDAISKEIGEGKRLVMESGFIFLYKEDLFAQIQADTETDIDNVKVALLTMNIHVLA